LLLILLLHRRLSHLTDTYKYCSPTRGSLLTGRYPWHLVSTRCNLIPSSTPEGVDLRYEFLPKHMARGGYGAAVEKTLYGCNVTSSTGVAGVADALDSASSSSSSPVYVLPFRFGAGTDSVGRKGVLLVNKKAASVTITLVGLSSGDATAGTGGGAAVATVVEVAPEFAGGPGFQPPVKRAVSVGGELKLGPFAVAVVLE
jgi:hypothetical protein